MIESHPKNCTCRICTAERKVMVSSPPTFEEEVAARKAFVRANHPLMDRPEPKAVNILIPREVALANAREELQFHLLCAGKWRAEVERLEDTK